MWLATLSYLPSALGSDAASSALEARCRLGRTSRLCPIQSKLNKCEGLQVAARLFDFLVPCLSVHHMRQGRQEDVPEPGGGSGA